MHKNHLKTVIFLWFSVLIDENLMPKTSSKMDEKSLFSFILNKLFSSFLHKKD